MPAVGDISSSPTLASTALARFEFEPGRGNEGTKILMVEWEDERQSDADWEIRWEGKTTTLSGRDGIEGKLRRLYFLLPPGVTVPRSVTLAQDDGVEMKTNPLPAIFPPQLGASARTAGKKGVSDIVCLPSMGLSLMVSTPNRCCIPSGPRSACRSSKPRLSAR